MLSFEDVYLLLLVLLPHEVSVMDVRAVVADIESALVDFGFEGAFEGFLLHSFSHQILRLHILTLLKHLSILIQLHKPTLRTLVNLFIQHPAQRIDGRRKTHHLLCRRLRSPPFRLGHIHLFPRLGQSFKRRLQVLGHLFGLFRDLGLEGQSWLY